MLIRHLEKLIPNRTQCWWKWNFGHRGKVMLPHRWGLQPDPKPIVLKLWVTTPMGLHMRYPTYQIIYNEVITNNFMVGGCHKTLETVLKCCNIRKGKVHHRRMEPGQTHTQSPFCLGSETTWPLTCVSTSTLLYGSLYLIVYPQTNHGLSSHLSQHKPWSM